MADNALQAALEWLKSPQRTQQTQGLGNTLEAAINKLGQSRSLDEALWSQAFQDPANPLKVTNPEAFAQLTRRTMEGPMSLAPVGMIGTRFKTGTPTEVPGFGPAKEIPDTYSYLKPEVLKEMSAVFGRPVTLQDILEHPSLYRDYPELAKYPVQGLGLFQKDLKGAYGEGKFYLERKFNPTPEDLKASQSTLLHEVQHAIQELDKMPIGGMTEDFLSKGYQKAVGKISKMRDSTNAELKTALEQKGLPSGTYYDILFNNAKGQEAIAKFPEIGKLVDYTRKLQKADMKLQDKYQEAFNKYRSYAGEAQARAVQKRFETPGAYNKPVTESYDVPIDSLIYKDPMGYTIK